MSKNKKLVPKRRFKEFQNSDAWEQRELGEVVQITMGQSPLGSNYTENPSDYILVQGNADMKNGKVFPRIWTTQVTKTAEPDDIILSVRAPVGDVGKTDYNVVLGRGVAGIKGNEFIYQLLSKMKSNSYWGKYSTGSTFDSINSNDLKEANICIPSINEQVQIGSFFRNLDQTIAFQQRKLEKMKSMKSAYLSEMFPAEGERKPKRRFPGFTDDWKQRELGKVLGNLTDGDWIEKEHISDKGKYRIIQTGNIGIGEYYNKGKDAKFLNQSSFDVLNGNEIFPGDILISRLAEPAGRTIILPNTGSRMVTAVDVAIVRPNSNFSSYFIQTMMNTNETLKKINEEASGSTRKRISRKNLELIDLIIPEIQEQEKIGNFFKNLDQTIAFQQQKLEKLQNIKKAYLNEMFI